MSSAEKPGGPATTLVLHPLDPLRFAYGIPMLTFGAAFLVVGDWSIFWLAVTAVLCLVVGFVLTAMGATAVVDGARRTFFLRETLLFIPLSRTRLGPGEVAEVRVVFVPPAKGQRVGRRKVEVVAAGTGDASRVQCFESAVDAWRLANKVADYLGVRAVERTKDGVEVPREALPLAPEIAPAEPAAPLEPVPPPTVGRMGRVVCEEVEGLLTVRVESANALDMNLLKYVVGTAVLVVIPLAAAASQSTSSLMGTAMLVCLGLISMPIIAYLVSGWLRLKTRWSITAGPKGLTFRRTRLFAVTFTIRLDGVVFDLGLDPTMSAEGAKRCVLVHAPGRIFPVGTGLDWDELGYLVGCLEGLVAWRRTSG